MTSIDPPLVVAAMAHPLARHPRVVAPRTAPTGPAAEGEPVTSPVPVPPQAITAAAEAIAAQRRHLWDVDFCEVQALARAVVEAAAPHLAAAERETCAALADDEAATLAASEGTGHRALRRFAALLRGKDPHAT